MDDQKCTSSKADRPVSHSTFYRQKASEADKLPALKLDADAKAETFSFTLQVPPECQISMRTELADVFTKTFGQPAKLKAPSTVISNVGRFGSRLTKLLDSYDKLDTQERKVAELILLMGDNDFELSDRMIELSRLGRDFSTKLGWLRDAGVFPRMAGPEFDPRVRMLVLHLENIYRRYFDAELTRSKSADGTYNGPFITFCRAACEHFLGAEVVQNATLEQAVLWVATRP